jgi:hypothetical protein
VTLRTVIADLLPKFDILEFADQPGGEHKRDQERRHRRIDDAEALVPKDVQERKFSMERIQPVEEHSAYGFPTQGPFK